MSRKIPGRDAGKETILIYRMDGTEEGQKLKKTAASMGIRCRVIEPDQVSRPLGELLHIPGYELVAQSFGQNMEGGMAEMAGEAEEKRPADPADMTEPAMIMQGFTQSRLDEFLKGLKRNGMPRIDLKAVVTPYNIGWRFADLYKELEAEREAVLEARRAWEARKAQETQGVQEAREAQETQETWEAPEAQKEE